MSALYYVAAGLADYSIYTGEEITRSIGEPTVS